MRRPDVDPISERAWVRIEQHVFAELDAEVFPGEERSSHRIVWGVAVLGAATLVVVVWTRTPGSDARGSARIVTGESGSQLTLSTAAVGVDANSIVEVFDKQEDGVRLVVERGAVACDVAPRHGRPPFVVDAGDVHVSVVGTRFVVRRTADSARVHVERGTVMVSRWGRTWAVTAGHDWPEVSQIESSSVLPELPPEGPVLEVAPRVQDVAPLLRSPSPERHSKVNVDSARVFDEAARLEAADPDRAVTLYRGLAAGSGAWGANALYAAARLENERGHREESRRLLAEYLQRFPTGANVEDAEDLLAR